MNSQTTRLHRTNPLFPHNTHFLSPLDHAVPQYRRHVDRVGQRTARDAAVFASRPAAGRATKHADLRIAGFHAQRVAGRLVARTGHRRAAEDRGLRSEEHTSELQSLMRISYAVFCMTKKKEHQ